MALETFGDIDDLVATNPVDNTDTVASMGAHIRGIKSTLQTDFPNITGPMTATQAELNLLGSQEGGFLLKANSTGGGTADAITADFTPNISLTDGVTVIVRAQGANTVTTPTFNPDGLGAKTIVKNSDEALIVGDISGASHELILKYNSTNDNWSLLNPKSTPLSSYVPSSPASYTGGIETHIEDSGAWFGVFDVDANVTESTWESVGPTGSGATNIVADLDIVPSGAVGLIARIYATGRDTATAGVYSLDVYGRATGSGLAAGTGSRIYSHSLYTDAVTAVGGMQNTIIPIDSSGRFDLYWVNGATVKQQTINFQFLGWIE